MSFIIIRKNKIITEIFEFTVLKDNPFTSHWQKPYFGMERINPLVEWAFNLKLDFSELAPGPKVIKLFLCSTQLGSKYQLLIKTKY